MQFELESTKEVPLLSRKRISGFLTYEGATPSLLAVKQKIASQLKLKEDLVVVRHIYPRFGLQKAKLIVHIYSNKKDLMKLEDKKSLSKNGFLKKEGEQAEGTPEQSAEKSVKPAEQPVEQPAKEEA